MSLKRLSLFVIRMERNVRMSQLPSMETDRWKQNPLSCLGLFKQQKDCGMARFACRADGAPQVCDRSPLVMRKPWPPLTPFRGL